MTWHLSLFLQWVLPTEQIVCYSEWVCFSFLMFMNMHRKSSIDLQMTWKSLEQISAALGRLCSVIGAVVSIESSYLYLNLIMNMKIKFPRLFRHVNRCALWLCVPNMLLNQISCCIDHYWWSGQGLCITTILRGFVICYWLFTSNEQVCSEEDSSCSPDWQMPEICSPRGDWCICFLIPLLSIKITMSVFPTSTLAIERLVV